MKTRYVAKSLGRKENDTYTPRGEVGILTLNPLSTRLRNLNFQPLEVVSRYRDPQLQMTENLCYV